MAYAQTRHGLHLIDVKAGYNRSNVLIGVSMAVEAGEAVALIGRNGMGKTTTIRAIFGLVEHHGGTISFAGQSLAGLSPYRIARLGIGLVPEGRQIFPLLSVEENLIATAANRLERAQIWTLPRVYSTFPRLKERRSQLASTLSGGEQQMLAIGRALMTNPALLILDEATEGLAPLIRAEIWHCLADLKREGQSILIIDKNLDDLIALADRHYVIEKGQIVWSGTSQALQADRAVIEQRVGV